MSYRVTIQEVLKIDDRRVARQVEAMMRVEHPTLDGLTAAQFQAEAHIAYGAVLEAGDTMAERIADSYGPA